jgi:hypothetical protein
MTHTYKVTVIGLAVTDWMDIRNAIFSGNQTLEETYGGQEGTFTFSEPQTPADLGPLVKVELLPSE